MTDEQIEQIVVDMFNDDDMMKQKTAVQKLLVYITKSLRDIAETNGGSLLRVKGEH